MNKIEKAYTDNPIDRYNKLVKEQIMPACDFVNAREAFNGQYGAVIPMILDYTKHLESQVTEQQEQIQSLTSTIKILTEEIIRLKQ